MLDQIITNHLTHLAFIFFIALHVIGNIKLTASVKIDTTRLDAGKQPERALAEHDRITVDEIAFGYKDIQLKLTITR